MLRIELGARRAEGPCRDDEPARHRMHRGDPGRHHDEEGEHDREHDLLREAYAQHQHEHRQEDRFRHRQQQLQRAGRACVRAAGFRRSGSRQPSASGVTMAKAKRHSSAVTRMSVRKSASCSSRQRMPSTFDSGGRKSGSTHCRRPAASHASATTARVRSRPARTVHTLHIGEALYDAPISSSAGTRWCRASAH